MKNILLTGSSGFIGSSLLNELSKKYKIYCIVRSKNKKLKKRNVVDIYFKNYINLNKKLSKINFFSVIHCATHYRKVHSKKDVDKMIESNIKLGNLILENNKILNCEKFINLTTVWENFNGIKNNPLNLYSAYKLAFSNIIKFYSKRLNKVKFYNLYLSETFGIRDKRKKLFNTLKENYKKRKVSKLISKNIEINILNVKDITLALQIILEKKINPDSYSILNNKNINILKLITKFNKIYKKKILYKYYSNKIIKEKIFKFKILPSWRPKNSSLNDMMAYISDQR